MHKASNRSFGLVLRRRYLGTCSCRCRYRTAVVRNHYRHAAAKGWYEGPLDMQNEVSKRTAREIDGTPCFIGHGSGDCNYRYATEVCPEASGRKIAM